MAQEQQMQYVILRRHVAGAIMDVKPGQFKGATFVKKDKTVRKIGFKRLSFRGLSDDPNHGKWVPDADWQKERGLVRVDEIKRPPEDCWRTVNIQTTSELRAFGQKWQVIDNLTQIDPTRPATMLYGDGETTVFPAAKK